MKEVKKYRLLNEDGYGPYYVQGEVYSEKYTPNNYFKPVSQLVKDWPFDWELVMNKEEKTIIGYECPFDMTGTTDFVRKGTIFTKENGEFFYFNDAYNKAFRKNNLPKEIVEKWKPVYAPEKTLPKIGSWEGEELSNCRVKYGCKTIGLRFIKDALFLGIKRISIESTEVTRSDMQQIVKYFETK